MSLHKNEINNNNDYKNMSVKNARQYTISNTSYKNAKNNYNNKDVLYSKVSSSVKNYSKKIGVKIVKSPYNVTKTIYDGRTNKYSKTAKKIVINKSNKSIRFKKIPYQSYKFVSKDPTEWDKAKFQRKLEDFERWRTEKTLDNLRDVKYNKQGKWLSRKFREKEKNWSKVKNMASFPYNTNKSSFKKTYEDVRVGENEAGRETIDKLQKEVDRYKNLATTTKRKVDEKIKYSSYKNKKSKQLSDKINRIDETNRFKKTQIEKLNKNKYAGKERFVKKTKAIKKFNKNNRFTLRQRFVDRIKDTFKTFFTNIKNPVKAFSMLFRVIFSVKTLLIVVVPLIIVISLFAGFGTSAKTNAVNEESVLVEQDSIFAGYHSKYNEQRYLAEVKSKYPNYDNYEVDLTNVGYDNYEILAYLNIAYGNVEDDKEKIMSEIKVDLKEIFDKLYREELKETVEKRIEYVDEVKEDGTIEKVAQEKIIKTLKVTVKKTDELRNILLNRLYQRKANNWFFNLKILNSDIDIWFDSLVQNKLGVSNIFAVSINSQVAIAGVVDRGTFSSENSTFGQPSLANPVACNYAFGQCTWYAHQRRHEIGNPMPHSTFGDGGSWWITAQNLGMSVDHNPKAGDVVSFPAGVAGALPPWGHVAFVEKVNEDGSIEVSEMNGGNTVDGIIRYRHIPKEAIPYSYFIH